MFWVNNFIFIHIIDALKHLYSRYLPILVRHCLLHNSEHLSRTVHFRHTYTLVHTSRPASYTHTIGHNYLSLHHSHTQPFWAVYRGCWLIVSTGFRVPSCRYQPHFVASGVLPIHCCTCRYVRSEWKYAARDVGVEGFEFERSSQWWSSYRLIVGKVSLFVKLVDRLWCSIELQYELFSHAGNLFFAARFIGEYIERIVIGVLVQNIYRFLLSDAKQSRYSVASRHWVGKKQVWFFIANCILDESDVVQCYRIGWAEHVHVTIRRCKRDQHYE